MKLIGLEDYKEFLGFRVKESRGNLGKLAKAAQCQPSYLIRVIRAEAHLTPDQAHRLCRYWAFSATEITYFMRLVELARAGDAAYRSSLLKEIHALIEQETNLGKVVNRGGASEVQNLLDYHADWRISLLHFLSACSGGQSKEKICRRLALDEEDFERIFKLLEERGLVRWEGKKVRFTSGSGHIPKTSPVLPIFLSNWRSLAMQNCLKRDEASLHFSNVQTIAKRDVARFLDLAREYIKDAKSICDASPSEEVAIVNLDVFFR